MQKRQFQETMQRAGVVCCVLSAMIGVSVGTTSNAFAQQVQSVTPMDAITVTATRTAKSALEAPAAISVADREAIQRSQPQSLDDILRGMPGVQMSGGPRNTAEEPNIRGLGNDRVVVRTDGVRKNFSSGHRGRTFIDPTLLKQVSVLRGPSSLLYGSGALGGVVDMETVDASDLLRPGENLGFRTSLGYQTNNEQQHATATAFGRPTEGVDLLASVTRSASAKYVDGNGNDIPFSEDSIKSALGKASFEHEGHSIKLSAQTFHDDHVIPTSANTNGTVIANRKTLENSGSVTYGYEGFSGLLDLNATAYINGTKIREFVRANSRHDITQLDTVGLDVANTSRVNLGETIDLAVTYGFEVYEDVQEGRRNDAPRPQFPSAEQITQGYFAQAEVTVWDDLSVITGLRYDSYDQEATGQRDVSDSRLSKKLAASYQATDWLMVYGSYAEAFRAPSLTELYVSGAHFAFNQFVPNPDLKAEFAQNKEIGVALSFDEVALDRDALRIKTSVFQNDVEDYIEQTVQGGAFGTTTRANVPEARIKGVELEVAYDAPDYFGGLSATSLHSDNLATGQALGSIPEDIVSLSAGMKWPELGLTAGWRASLYMGQTDVPPTGTARPGAKTVHDVFVSYVPNDRALDGLRVDFGIDNIFDKSYQRYPSELEETGRNAKITASYQF